MKIKEVIQFLETIAPPVLQESYDNSGLIVGNKETECKGCLVCLDVTEAVVQEATMRNCDLIISHHPIIFKGLKKLNGHNLVERTVISAIKNDIAIYAIHTNLDNVIDGVNRKLADKLGLQNCGVLLPKEGTLKKLITFCPVEHAESIRDALFAAGCGAIGNYSECSFNIEGHGTFKPLEGSDPFIGEKGRRHVEKETRIEMIFSPQDENKIIASLKKAHPYEEVAYYVSSLSNVRKDIGSGLIGELKEPAAEKQFLEILKKSFHLSVIKHTRLLNKKIATVALCGGSGYFLLKEAISSGADIYITGDIKYHEFFDADDQIVLADIGHFESEQFTIDLIAEILQKKLPNFAVLKTQINTNPVSYYT